MVSRILWREGPCRQRLLRRRKSAGVARAKVTSTSSASEPVFCWRCKAEDHTIGDCPVDLVVEEVGKENHDSDAQEELRSLLRCS